MVKYSAYRCESAIYNRTPGLTFHQFPKDESTRNAWLKYMKRQDWQPNTYSVLSVFCFKINKRKSGSRIVNEGFKNDGKFEIPGKTGKADQRKKWSHKEPWPDAFSEYTYH
ncbi:hypothetical protein evm_006717 [Chilo suppressalis]|nr:hypothetical protein evm_006717 [Chilo suppressalis]